MKKLFKVIMCLALALIVPFGLVACDKDDDAPPENQQEQAIKERFDDAYQMLLDANNYVQEITYYDEGSNRTEKVITNIADGVTKLYFIKDNEENNMYYIIEDINDSMKVTAYEFKNRTYIEKTYTKQELLAAGGKDLIITQTKYNQSSCDFKFNYLFDLMTMQYSGTAKYSTITEDGYEYITYKMTSSSLELQITAIIEDEKVISVSVQEKHSSDNAPKTRVNTFRYSGADVTINLNLSDFEKVTEW